MLLTINLTPAQMARHLAETYGYSASAAVVVKYDNEILRKERGLSGGSRGIRRTYTMGDVALFNAIFVMRSLGYSIEAIRNVFDLDLNNPVAEKECSAFIDMVKEKVARQRKGLDLYTEFLPQLKGRYPCGRMRSSLFKPATPQEFKQREKDSLAADRKGSKGKA